MSAHTLGPVRLIGADIWTEDGPYAHIIAEVLVRPTVPIGPDEGHANAEFLASAWDMEAFFRLTHEGGIIVSFNECSSYEISQARACKRMFVDADGFGYVYRPKTENAPAQSQEVDREILDALIVAAIDLHETKQAMERMKAQQEQNPIRIKGVTGRAFAYWDNVLREKRELVDALKITVLKTSVLPMTEAHSLTGQEVAGFNITGIAPDRGHGHVFPRLDGVKARCGGPAFCPECKADAQQLAALREPSSGIVTGL